MKKAKQEQIAAKEAKDFKTAGKINTEIIEMKSKKEAIRFQISEHIDEI